MKSRGIVLLDKGAGREITQRLCTERKLPIELLDELTQMELEFIGRERRRGLTDRIEEIIGRYMDQEV